MLGERLKEIREDMNIKQQDLAKKLNVKRSTLAGWENNFDIIPIRQLIKYANMYNYSLDFLFGIKNYNEQYKELQINLYIMSKNLIKYRKKHNKSQKDIAKILSTSQGAYSHYENAMYIIPTSFLYALSKYYKNFSIDELFGRKKV